ncbi:MAG: EamA family transporter [Clostridium sp.]|nr:EamA family transporter [Clostridium sp.]
MDKLKISAAMFIFGTIGVFTKYIPLPSSVLAMLRGAIGFAFLLPVACLTGNRPSLAAIRRNLPLLLLSGAALGVNWIFLFEAYRHTTVAIAILCYYMQPVIVILLSPLLLKERLTGKKLVCVGVALVGMLLISGVLQDGLTGTRGIVMGLVAAVFYSVVVFCNKFLQDIASYDCTIVQLGVAAVVLLPYTLLNERVDLAVVTPVVVILVLVVGIVHTGIAFALYFGGVQNLAGQTIAIISYIDPASAILLSVFVLREPMDLAGIIGAVLILGSTLVSELEHKPKKSLCREER